MTPRDQPGYYPKFSTLAQQNYWDEATRAVVLRRVNEVPELQFWNPEEARTMQAVFNALLPQDDRTQKIPVLRSVDARLHKGQIDGYQFDTMPPDARVYRLAPALFNAMAQDKHGADFADLTRLQQDQALESIHDGEPWGPATLWTELPTNTFWMLLINDAVAAYYAHPLAWDEIGFGGPAYPRGYMRLERGLPEPWEVDEQRYEWTAPSDTVSDTYKQVADKKEHGGHTGAAGTH